MEIKSWLISEQQKNTNINRNNNKLYNESIILIGPSGAGKTTVSEKLSQKTGMQNCRLDRISHKAKKNGLADKFKNIDRFNLFMISELLKIAKEKDLCGIVDFGGGHSVYEDMDAFEKLKELLKPFKNIVLLLPDKDEEKSLDIMERRSTGDITDNRRFIESPCNKELATMIIYGNGRQASEIADEILQVIKERNEQQLEIE